MIKTVEDYAKDERYDLLRYAFNHDGDERFNDVFDNIIQLTNSHDVYSTDTNHPFYNRIKTLVAAAQINEFSDDDYYKEAFDAVFVIAKLIFGEDIRKLTLETIEVDNSIEYLTKKLAEKIEAKQEYPIQNMIDNTEEEDNDKN